MGAWWNGDVWEVDDSGGGWRWMGVQCVGEIMGDAIIPGLPGPSGAGGRGYTGGEREKKSE